MHPTKGDWASNALELVKKFELNLALKEIEALNPGSFKKLVRIKITEIAFRELQNKQQRRKKENDQLHLSCRERAISSTKKLSFLKQY